MQGYMPKQTAGKISLWVTSALFLNVQHWYIQLLRQVAPTGSDDGVHYDYYVLEHREAAERNWRGKMRTEWVVGEVHSKVFQHKCMGCWLMYTSWLIVADWMFTPAVRHGLIDSGATPKLVSALVPLNCNRGIRILKKKVFKQKQRICPKFRCSTW
jgi:hypothetical protein